MNRAIAWQRGFIPALGHRSRAFGRSGRSTATAAGFTLIEVLLATMLLAAGLALGFATVRAAGATVERGEAMAARNERMRAVSEFLRSRIGGAQGIIFNLDEASGQAQRFIGEAHSMRFVADLPDYLGRGGPHLHAFNVENRSVEDRSVEGRAGAQVLQVDFRMVLAGQTLTTADARPPEPLVQGLRSVRFSYRTNPRGEEPAPWQPQWEYPEALPSQVRVEISDAQGPWPILVIVLRQAASYGVDPEPGK